MGQVDNPGVLFYSSSGGAAFGRGSVTLHSRSQENGGTRLNSAVRISFPGSEDAMPQGVDPVPWRTNYFMGSDPAGWVSGADAYRGVMYEGLWDGIDLLYHAGQAGLKYDIVIHPGADPSLIRMQLEGHTSLSLAESGGLSIGTGLGPGSDIIDSGLDVFYLDDHSEKVRAEFVLIDDSTYSFALGPRDRSRAIVIDPMMFSTFLGGSGTDQCMDVATDAEGCTYVVGQTDSPDFPTTLGVFETDYFGYTYDIFVAKLAPGGDSLVYSTYLGDEGADHGTSIAVDSAGNAYITGYTSSDGFPTTPGAFDRDYGGDTYDGFLTKLGPGGDALAYSTFIGGTRVDMCYGVAVDSNGYAYVTGDTWSYDIPITYDAMNRVFNGGQTGANDGFVTKFSPLGDAVVYSTFIGHGDYDYCMDIAVDSSGCAHVVGYTRSAGFPTTPGALDRTHNGGFDVFVTKLTRSGSAYSYSTLLGGSSSDYGYSIALGRWGDAYITGCTASANFPVTDGAFSSSNSGWYDAFVAALNPYGGALLYSTYLGGAGGDYAYGITLDSMGHAQITGLTVSADFPTTADALDRTINGASDAFVAKLGQSGESLVYSTYLGGNGNETGRGIAIDSNLDTIIVGETTSYDFPTVPGSMDRYFNGMADAFISSIDLAPPKADAGPDQFVDEGSIAYFNGIRSRDNHAIINYTWKFHDGSTHVTRYNVTANHTFMIPGEYTIFLNVTDLSGNRGRGTMILTVRDTTLPVAAAGPDQSVDEGMTVLFNGSASSDNVGITNHTWHFVYGGAGTYLFGANASFRFRNPGTYLVALTVADAAGNTASDNLTVTVRDITSPIANAGPDSAIRMGSSFTFNGSASRDNVGIENYTWSFNDGLRNVALYGRMPQHTFNAVGSFAVELRVTDRAGHTASDTMTLTVLETVDPVADAGPDMTVDELAAARFDGSGSTDNVGVFRWAWSFFDGANNVTLLGVSPSWVFTVPGIYEVILNVSDAAGNWDTDRLTVTVLDVLDPTPATGPNKVALQGSTVDFNGYGSHDSSGISDHVWTFAYNGSQVTLDGPVQSFQFWTPGQYAVTLTVTDNAGRTASGEMVVTILQPEALVPRESQAWIAALAAAALLLAAALYLWLRGGKGAGE
jgi:PKD repeat protein